MSTDYLIGTALLIGDDGDDDSTVDTDEQGLDDAQTVEDMDQEPDAGAPSDDVEQMMDSAVQEEAADDADFGSSGGGGGGGDGGGGYGPSPDMFQGAQSPPPIPVTATPATPTPAVTPPAPAATPTPVAQRPGTTIQPPTGVTSKIAPAATNMNVLAQSISPVTRQPVETVQAPSGLTYVQTINPLTGQMVRRQVSIASVSAPAGPGPTATRPQVTVRTAARPGSFQGMLATRVRGKALSSPLVGVSDEDWTTFADAMRTQNLGGVSASNELGQWAMKPRRLADIGVMIGVTGQRDARSGRLVWVGDFVAPMTMRRFLGDAKAQYLAFSKSMQQYLRGLGTGKIARPKDRGVTVSGALAVLHRAGPKGLEKWNDPEQRFNDTVRLVSRVNGLF